MIYEVTDYNHAIIITTRHYHLFKVVENRMQQCCAAHIVHSCLQYCSMFSIVTPDCGLIQAQQC